MHSAVRFDIGGNRLFLFSVKWHTHVSMGRSLVFVSCFCHRTRFAAAGCCCCCSVSDVYVLGGAPACVCVYTRTHTRPAYMYGNCKHCNVHGGASRACVCASVCVCARAHRSFEFTYCLHYSEDGHNEGGAGGSKRARMTSARVRAIKNSPNIVAVVACVVAV